MTAILVLTISLILMGGSFQFGYHTGVINEPLEVLGEFIANASYARGIDLNDEAVNSLKTVAVTMFPVGGLFGALMAGFFADKFGRKKSMLIFSVPTIVACIVMGVSKSAVSYELLIIGRFLVGVPSGTFTAIAPMYLAEIAPINLRGALGVMNQLMIVFAILISVILGLPQVLGNSELWPLLLAFSAIPSFFTLILLPFSPESPRYLYLSVGDAEATRKALQKLRGKEDVEEEIHELELEKIVLGSVQQLSIIEAFKTPYVRWPMMIGIVMQLSQQLSGINAVINYSTTLFKETANLSTLQAEYATLGIGAFNVIITFVSVFLMDRLGRKTLHLSGLSLMAFWTALMTLMLALRHQFPKSSSGEAGMVYTCVVCVFLFVGSFAIGPGAIPWFITAEMFTQASRGAAMTVCVAVNWICQILIAQIYPTMLKYLKDYSFVPFFVLIVLFAVFTWFFVPETKGRTPEDLENSFKRRSLNYQPIESSANINPDTTSNASRGSLLNI